jgi:murein DD-endopeptidase MepM/ murein hydrolase activator NlpD
MHFPGLRALTRTRNRSVLAAAFMVAAVSLWVAPSASARTTSASARQPAPTPFLTLPFVPTPTMRVLSGWYYSSSGSFHGGIDFISGNVNSVGTWRTFAVIASADGEACGNCTSRQGNAVWIKHNIDGRTYYTYYGHLASIDKSIPRGSQSRTVPVKRGDFLGWAGDTGASGLLHLHYGLYNAASQPIDPFSIGKLREYYPQPTSEPAVGWFLR